MVFDRARQCAAFDITTDRHIVIGPQRVADTLDRLVDDGPLVQIAGDVMRRGADQLDAAFMRLGVVIGTLEAGQKAVMDVDNRSGTSTAASRRNGLTWWPRRFRPTMPWARIPDRWA